MRTRKSPSSRTRLSSQDWVEAGLQALTTSGPDAVAVEPLATVLGATKGSGYWHFANRQALLSAVLERWHEAFTVHVIDHVEEAGGSPAERLGRLLAIVSTSAVDSPAELLVLGSHDPTVRAAVERSVTLRIAYIEQLVRAAGVSRADARSRAVLAYSAYLGNATLAAMTPKILPRSPADRRRMRRGLMRIALPEAED